MRGLMEIDGAVCLVASLVGCGMWTGNHKKTNDDSYKVQNYRQDGMLGITNVNPNRSAESDLSSL